MLRLTFVLVPVRAANQSTSATGRRPENRSQREFSVGAGGGARFRGPRRRQLEKGRLPDSRQEQATNHLRFQHSETGGACGFAGERRNAARKPRSCATSGAGDGPRAPRPAPKRFIVFLQARRGYFAPKPSKSKGGK